MVQVLHSRAVEQQRSVRMPLPGLPYSDDELFPITNAVLPVWVLLAAAPTWKWTDRVVTGLCLFNSLIYVGLAADTFFVHPVDGAGFQDFANLDGLLKLFSNRTTMFAGWMHYLVFDLFVGRWVAQDGAAVGVPRLVMLPCLFFVLMLGPVGFAMYMMILRPLFSGGTRGKRD